MELSLKTRNRTHVVTFWEKTQDSEIQKMFPFSVESMEEALRLYEESQQEEAQSYGRVIYYDGQYIGDIWCYGIDESDEKMAMLSIVIFEKELWGNGIAKYAIKEFVTEMFNKYAIDKIGAFTYAFNDRSISLLEKVGFVCIESFIEDDIESFYLELTKR